MNWLKFWAYLGIRNEYQKDLSAQRVAEVNYQYLHAYTNYLTKSDLRHLFGRSFSTILCVEKEYLAAGEGYGSRIAKIPLIPSLFGALVHRVIAVA